MCTSISYEGFNIFFRYFDQIKSKGSRRCDKTLVMKQFTLLKLQEIEKKMCIFVITGNSRQNVINAAVFAVFLENKANEKGILH